MLGLPASMTAENSAEVSSKMKSAVAEIGWNSLESLSSGGEDDLSGFGSFSDFLTLSNGDAPAPAPAAPVPAAAAAVQGFEQPVVVKQVAAAVDQVKEVDASQAFSTSSDSVDLYPGWTFNYQTGQWEQNKDAAAAQSPLSNGVAEDRVDGPVQSFEYPVSNHHQVAGAKLGLEPENSIPAAVEPVKEEVQVNSYSQISHSSVDSYEGWAFNYETKQWEQTKEAVAVAQSSEAAVVQEVSAASQQDPYPGWTYNYQTCQWVEKSSEIHQPQTQFQAQPQFQAQSQPQFQFQPQSQYESYQPQQFQPQPQQFQPQSQFPPQLQSQPHVQPQFQSQLQAQPQFQSQFHSQYQTQVQSQFQPQVQWQPVNSVATRSHQESAGRPAYSFAFGLDGRLVITKPKDPFAVEQASTIQIYHLSQLGASDLGFGHVSGPLVGNASMKEVMKYVDDRITKTIEDPGQKTLRYLWGALKISCKNYGNIRSNNMNGPVVGSQDDNGPEAALAKLLDPNTNQEFRAFDARGLKPLPSEQQMQATAFDVKRLLISGKRQEALRAAQDGQLWGTALVLAQQLGEKFYSDTIAMMAQRQFQPGFPLRTLSLLYAGQHTGVFAGSSGSSNVSSSPQGQPGSFADEDEDANKGMLEEWEENLAIMAANPTNGDERVIMYLGDCLWRQNEVFGAHLCYLVANTNFEPFSTSARLCLIGADHCKYPRTYASPEAIQRTELFEFAKVSGNSQFSLLPFQPYKLIYASMLAEAGRVNDALRYCQAVQKTLRTAGHPADACKEAATALEERLRVYSQGGPTSIVNRIFGNIGFPKFSKTRDEGDNNTRPVSTVSRSSSFLAPSASMEPISESTGRSSMPVRSVSEPDFRPAQMDSPSKNPNKNAFSAFVHRAIGLIRTPSKEAKLGDSNKFRFDEKLKRWVEEGAETPAEELVLAPPPMTKMTVSREADNGFTPEKPALAGYHASTPERPVVSGIPPMPPSSNQYSARARQNVRSRYVDTFNKGGVNSAPPKPSESLFLPPTKAASLPPAKFFVPAAQAFTSMNNNKSEVAAESSVEDSLKLTGNGPVAFGHPIVQDQELVPAALSNGDAAVWGATSSSYSLAAAMEAPGNSLGTFYASQQPAMSLPGPPPVLEVNQPLMLVDSSSRHKEAALIHTTDKTSAAGAATVAFGDDMQEVEL